MQFAFFAFRTGRFIGILRAAIVMVTLIVLGACNLAPDDRAIASGPLDENSTHEKKAVVLQTIHSKVRQ